ncbi:hypothetical protein PR202_gb00193 [Eleusine coracana subsp. coracana]|uniref:Reverse transcriptase zinc-binding domain-containing protein n=1 Tax=Eleusine coracana subsp. coracana TaxID=191504 RepID=A0AAV5DQZ4_ELECO|nr:hypothetical protein PR202_gb00193 [Eleusine coracana subsp. coracana]
MNALKKGLIWRIGDGQRVNIWLDPWIPNTATRRLVTPRVQNALNRACDLLDPITGKWDEQLVRDIFWEMDANLILSIPVRMEHDDYIAWHHDPKGLFTVKSAYHVLKDEQDSRTKKQVGESSTGTTSLNNEWSSIWKQQAQPKVLQFLWRLAHNSLPLRRSIKRRGMDTDTICPICHRLDEDGRHLFLKCKGVKQCWRSLCLEHVRCDIAELKTGATVVQRITKLDKGTRELVMNFLWAWWDARNKANTGDRQPGVQEVIHRAQLMTLSMAEASSNQTNHSVSSPNMPAKRWTPPPEDVLKINFDGAFVKDSRKGP